MTYKQATLAACLLGAALAAPALAQEPAYFSAAMFPRGVDGGGPARDATADFNGEADLVSGKLCYYFEAEGLSDITGSQILEGGKDGTPVVELQVGAVGVDEVCTVVDKTLLAAMAARPRGYTIVIRTVEFPDGALSTRLEE